MFMFVELLQTVKRWYVCSTVS